MSPIGQPHKIFFPLGLLCGLWGAAVWILFAIRGGGAYPGVSHPDLMVGGFLFSFVMGFFMTAVPRFTASEPASVTEVALGSFLVLVALAADGVSAWIPELRSCALIAGFLNMVLLAVFCGRRMPARSFAMVALALLLGLLGTGLLAAGELGWVSDQGFVVGKSLFYHGMTLALVLGGAARSRPKLSALVALLVAVSFPVEFLFAVEPGRSFRALAATFVAFTVWGEMSSRWFRLSSVFLVLGLWIYALIPAQAVAGAHLAFVGGFSLMTLFVATKVTLNVSRPKVMGWMSALLVIAALTRYLAVFTPQSYVSHLAYASVTWIVATLLWAMFFIPPLRKKFTTP